MSSEENAESKYEVREVIGKGAFGEVNLVVEKQTKQRYVLKRIKMARQSEWQRKATRQEIEIVSRLRHPFIMPYKEHWTHHGHTINVVYGYCEKGDLTTAITKQKGKYFPEETLRLWLAELLLAIDYMHRQHVLHRDIKTQNILLTGDGDVQIGDFGLSTVRVGSTGDAATLQKQQQSGSDDTDPCIDLSPAHGDMGNGMAPNNGAATPEPARLHHALATAHVPANPAGAEAYTNGLANAHANGHNAHLAGDKDKDQGAGHTPVHDPKAGTRNDYSLVGTPHFMSPELLSNQKYSYETDIWSLGVVMYELTTLKPPFNAFNLAGLVAKIKRASLPPIPSCYSTDWTSILKSMLKKDPTRRASPLDLLAVPSMQQALQQARQRAQAISPEYVLPEIPVHDTGVSPGFCFDVVPGIGACGVNAEQRTPHAVGPSTPVLLNVAASADDDVGGVEAEASPLSKFPDLGATADSPVPMPTAPAAAGGTAAATAAPAAAAQPAARTAADANRSKTPGIVRRSGSSAGSAPGAVATTGAAPATRRPMSPQRARGAPAVGGAPRSKTPGRAVVAAAAATKSEQEPSSRIMRKGILPQTSRSRNALPGMSPRDLSAGGGGGTGAAAAEAPPQTARAASPTEPSERQPGRRAGPSSGPAPRIAALGSVRAGGGRRSLLDAVPQPVGVTGPAAGAAPVPSAVVVPAGVTNDAEAEAASPAAMTAADATADVMKIVSPTSTGVKSSPAATTTAGAGAGHTTAGAIGGGRAAPWRTTARSVSVTTARTSRAALAVGSSPPQVSPTVDAGGHSVAVRRPVSVARGGSTDPTTGTAAVAAAATAAHAKRASVPAGDSQLGTGAKRTGAAADIGVNSLSSARTRAGGSPTYRATAASTVASAANARRRSQPGTLATAPKDTADAGAARQPEKRVRRSSYVSYGKPTESATLQRRPLAAPAPGYTAGVRESSAAAEAAAVSAASAGGAVTKGPGLVSSHPLASSDAALESNPPSVSCSPSENNAAAWDTTTANIGAKPNSKSTSGHVGQGGGDTAATGNVVGGGEADNVPLDADAGTAAAAPRAAGLGASHPWRQAPRSRSLLSMATEDSELSLPDGRYGPPEGTASAYDGEAAPVNTSFTTVPSTATTVIAPAASLQPMWNSNQLFSGSYGSCAGSLNDIGAQPAAASSAGAPPAGGLGSGQPSEAIGALGGTASITADLPRRVSASAFVPHLLYGNTAAAALASARTADGEGGGTESETSPPADVPRADMLSGLQRLTLKDSTGVLGSNREGGNGMDLVSPGRFDLVSTVAGAVAYSPSGFTSATASPHSAQYGGVGGVMEIISPTAVSGQHGSDFKQHRSGVALDARPAPISWQGGGADYYNTSPDASDLSARPADRAPRLQPADDDDTADSNSEVTSQLRPVQEDVDGEAESEQAAQPGARGYGQGVGHGAGSFGTSELTGSERAQLALLQRVVALAGSLWECGRDSELGAVLSSTLSRPLMRRPSASGSAASGPAWPAGSTEEQQQRSSRQHQPRVPELGDAVRVTAGPLRGVEAVVRYRGPCHWGAGTVLGLELPRTSSTGEKGDLHDPAAPPGCRDGVRYFHCRQAQNGAAFVAADQVVCVE